MTVPNAWNATDESEASFAGGVGWYRSDFRLPSARRGPAWVVRFESVNYRARIWLNGHPIGAHTGAYLPFEVTPAGLGAAPRRDQPPGRPRRQPPPGDRLPARRALPRGTPIGGWWNYGGLLREVYLRRVDGIDLAAVSVLPHVRCAACTARLDYRVQVRNLRPTTRRYTVRARLGGRRFALGGATIAGPGGRRVRRSVRVPQPAAVVAASPVPLRRAAHPLRGRAELQRYTLKTRIRSIRVVGGQLRLNGLPLHLRGVGLHEDSPDRGAAIDNACRDRSWAGSASWARPLSAATTRCTPTSRSRPTGSGSCSGPRSRSTSIKSAYLGRRSVRRAAAAELATNIAANGNHPSVTSGRSPTS